MTEAGLPPTTVAGLGRSFWTLWSASAVSTFGDGLRYVAFPLLAAGLTTDPRAVAVLFVAGYLPWPLFGLLGGAVVDRQDRRTVMWMTDTARAVAVGAFTAVLVTSATTIVSLAVLSFLLEAAETLFDNAASAIVPQLVAPARLERANSWLIGVQTLNSTLIGAPIGALLYGWRGTCRQRLTPSASLRPPLWSGLYPASTGPPARRRAPAWAPTSAPVCGGCHATASYGQPACCSSSSTPPSAPAKPYWSCTPAARWACPTSATQPCS